MLFQKESTISYNLTTSFSTVAQPLFAHLQRS
jgi:hypothetical protein